MVGCAREDRAVAGCAVRDARCGMRGAGCAAADRGANGSAAAACAALAVERGLWAGGSETRPIEGSGRYHGTVAENPGALPAETLAALATRFGVPGAALGLLGSHARGEAGRFSDIDMLLLVPDGAEPPAASSHLSEGRLAVVSPASESEATAWLERPELAVRHVAGLRQVRILADPAGRLAALRERAVAFRWTDDIERRADRWVGDAMAGWAEEALRGANGLERDDAGRMLLARFGLSWGLSWLMVVHERLLLVSESALLPALARALGEGSRWVALQRAAFGVGRDEPGRSLRQQVTAGLALYRETAGRVAAVLSPEERAVVDAALEAVDAVTR